jgi:hypothetical protein
MIFFIWGFMVAYGSALLWQRIWATMVRFGWLGGLWTHPSWVRVRLAWASRGQARVVPHHQLLSPLSVRWD